MDAVVRAKFVVTEVQTREWGHHKQTDITLEARGESSLPEDKRFHEATPQGKLTMTVTNPAALGHLKAGKIFYLDFVPAPDGITAFHS